MSLYLIKKTFFMPRDSVKKIVAITLKKNFDPVVETSFHSIQIIYYTVSSKQVFHSEHSHSHGTVPDSPAPFSAHNWLRFCIISANGKVQLCWGNVSCSQLKYHGFGFVSKGKWTAHIFRAAFMLSPTLQSMKYAYENATVLFSLLQYIELLQNHKPAMKA